MSATKNTFRLLEQRVRGENVGQTIVDCHFRIEDAADMSLLAADPMTQLAFSVYENNDMFALLLGSGISRGEAMAWRDRRIGVSAIGGSIDWPLDSQHQLMTSKKFVALLDIFQDKFHNVRKIQTIAKITLGNIKIRTHRNYLAFGDGYYFSIAEASKESRHREYCCSREIHHKITKDNASGPRRPPYVIGAKKLGRVS